MRIEIGDRLKLLRNTVTEDDLFEGELGDEIYDMISVGDYVTVTGPHWNPDFPDWLKATSDAGKTLGLPNEDTSGLWKRISNKMDKMIKLKEKIMGGV